MPYKLIPISIVFAAYASASMAALDPALPEQRPPVREIDDLLADPRCRDLQVVYLPEKSEKDKPALLQCALNASGILSCQSLVDFWNNYSTHPRLKGETEQIVQAILDNCPEDAGILIETESLPPPKPLTFEQE